MPRLRVFTWIPRTGHKYPVSYRRPGAKWPKGPLRTGAPREAHLARQIAANLDIYIRDSDAKGPNPTKQVHDKAVPVEQIAEDTEMSRETIYSVRDGKTWPDFFTIARLEIYFNCRLWGYEHRRPPHK